LVVKKGSKSRPLHLRAHALAGVTDGEHHVGAGYGGMVPGIGLVERGIGGFHRQAADFGNGIARIDRQVDDDLLDLAAVHLHLAQPGRQPASRSRCPRR
jgi:hypothetical protein